MSRESAWQRESFETLTIMKWSFRRHVLTIMVFILVALILAVMSLSSCARDSTMTTSSSQSTITKETIQTTVPITPSQSPAQVTPSQTTTGKTPADFTNDVGNSIGNLVNGGRFAQKEGWIYFQDYSGELSLARIKSNGTQKEPLLNHSIRQINVVGDWIYYLDEADQNRITRIRLNGTDVQRMADFSVRQLQVVGEWMVFSVLSGSSDQKGLFRMKTDGSQQQALINENIAWFVVSREWIFYVGVKSVQEKTVSLFKIRTDGTGNQKLTDEAGISSLIQEGEWLYYVCGPENMSLYRIKADGTGKLKLQEQVGDRLQSNAGLVYFSILTPAKSGIFRINADGSGLTAITDESTIEFYLLDDWIVYESMGEWIKIRKDGTGRSTLLDSASWAGPFATPAPLMKPPYPVGNGRDPANEPVHGNLNGNIANGGTFARQGDWLYFANKASDRSNLCRIKLDGTGFMVLNDTPAESVNVVGDRIYCISNVSVKQQMY